MHHLIYKSRFLVSVEEKLIKIKGRENLTYVSYCSCLDVEEKKVYYYQVALPAAIAIESLKESLNKIIASYK